MESQRNSFSAKFILNSSTTNVIPAIQLPANFGCILPSFLKKKKYVNFFLQNNMITTYFKYKTCFQLLNLGVKNNFRRKLIILNVSHLDFLAVLGADYQSISLFLIKLFALLPSLKRTRLRYAELIKRLTHL